MVSEVGLTDDTLQTNFSAIARFAKRFPNFANSLQIGILTLQVLIKSSLRKFILASHITFSIGWFGAVAAFVVLNVVVLTEKNFQTVRSSYIAMDLIGWYVILPAIH